MVEPQAETPLCLLNNPSPSEYYLICLIGQIELGVFWLWMPRFRVEVMRKPRLSFDRWIEYHRLIRDLYSCFISFSQEQLFLLSHFIR